MKRIILIMAIGLMTISTQAQVKLYLGAAGGVGDMLTHDQFKNLNSGSDLRNNNGWSSHFKAQALLGFGRLRFGYQFLYNFSSPSVAGYSATPTSTDPNENTTFFNASQVHFFGHYFLVQLAIINTEHFALVPGFAVGTFTGYKVDNTSDNSVTLSQSTQHRFSIGGELNAEIKFAKRWTFFVGPNYYLFSMQDRQHTDWHESLHFFGADLGLRINLLKVSE